MYRVYYAGQPVYRQVYRECIGAMYRLAPPSGGRMDGRMDQASLRGWRERCLLCVSGGGVVVAAAAVAATSLRAATSLWRLS